ncbi:methyltransferase domain-containing protein [Ilumatobacter nonamiensis]|uniref:methyltransferase domain-containing protein n=1 Tax=Ilumatobacter nonamiensis TaxID=467093 RepID=UPI00058C066C
MLEVGDRAYTARFGGSWVTGWYIVDIDAGNADVDFLGISNAALLPEVNSDCIILTETMQFLGDAQAALRSVERALKSGGTLLLTAPDLEGRVRG